MKIVVLEQIVFAIFDNGLDRNSEFEPRIVKKRLKDISEIDQKITSMYAKGMTTRQISDMLMDIYGFEASESFISDVTEMKLMPHKLRRGGIALWKASIPYCSNLD